MRNLRKKPLVIISAYRSGIDTEQNLLNHAMLISDLEEYGIAFKTVVGCYKGEKELSLVTNLPENLAKKLIKAYDQDCYLYVDSERNCELVYQTNRLSCGQLVEVSEKEALSNTSYTYDARYNRYYITVKRAA